MPRLVHSLPTTSENSTSTQSGEYGVADVRLDPLRWWLLATLAVALGASDTLPLRSPQRGSSSQSSSPVDGGPEVKIDPGGPGRGEALGHQDSDHVLLGVRRPGCAQAALPPVAPGSSRHAVTAGYGGQAEPPAAPPRKMGTESEVALSSGVR